MKKIAKVIRSLCGSEISQLIFFIQQKNILSSIGYLFQWNAGTETRLRQPSIETVLVESLCEVFKNIFEADLEDLMEKLWNSFTLNGEYRFITDRIVENLSVESNTELKIASMHFVAHLVSFVPENDYESKTNFVLEYELVERVLDEMQRTSYTLRNR